MMRSSIKKIVLWVGALAFVGGSAFASQYMWREQGLRSLQVINTQRVQLVTSALYAEINRQDHLPPLLSHDTDVINALKAPDDSSLQMKLGRKLQRISLEADTRAIFVIRADGVVIASDDWQNTDTMVGRNLAERRYFRNALSSGKSTSLEVEPETGRIRYFLAESVRDDALLGVVVVRVEFDSLESSWERAGERVAVTDKSGVVFLASSPVYKYRLMDTTDRSKPVAGPTPRYYRDNVPPISWQVLERFGASSIVRARLVDDGSTYLYESLSLPEYGWTVHRLADLTSVHGDQRDGAIIGAAISSLILLLLLYVGQRQRAYLSARDAGVQLMREVAERTRDLRDANLSLQTEVDERRRTEARLRSTQNELVQAGKLAALGQMSATLAHEINQPLAAIQTFIASAKIFTTRGEVAQVTRNLDLISDLAERMAALTAHLKTFARKSEPGHRERVQVDRAVDGALFLVQSRIKSAHVRIEKSVEPNLMLMGHAVQLEQVIVNLLLNALDAVAGKAHPEIRIDVRAAGDLIVMSIADNGSGIPPELIERIFDPFVTTKPVGKGLGLGLSISYGIVQDFHGRIYAANQPGGGASVTVELPRLTRDDVIASLEANHA